MGIEPTVDGSRPPPDLKSEAPPGRQLPNFYYIATFACLAYHIQHHIARLLDVARVCLFLFYLNIKSQEYRESSQRSAGCLVDQSIKRIMLEL